MEFVLVLIYFVRIQLCKIQTANYKQCRFFIVCSLVQYIFAKYLLEFFVGGNLMPADVKR